MLSCGNSKCWCGPTHKIWRGPKSIEIVNQSYYFLVGIIWMHSLQKRKKVIYLNAKNEQKWINLQNGSKWIENSLLGNISFKSERKKNMEPSSIRDCCCLVAPQSPLVCGIFHFVSWCLFDQWIYCFSIPYIISIFPFTLVHQFSICRLWFAAQAFAANKKATKMQMSSILVDWFDFVSWACGECPGPPRTVSLLSAAPWPVPWPIHVVCIFHGRARC